MGKRKISEEKITSRLGVIIILLAALYLNLIEELILEKWFKIQVTEKLKSDLIASAFAMMMTTSILLVIASLVLHHFIKTLCKLSGENVNQKKKASKSIDKALLAIISMLTFIITDVVAFSFGPCALELGVWLLGLVRGVAIAIAMSVILVAMNVFKVSFKTIAKYMMLVLMITASAAIDRRLIAKVTVEASIDYVTLWKTRVFIMIAESWYLFSEHIGVTRKLVTKKCLQYKPKAKQKNTEFFGSLLLFCSMFYVGGCALDLVIFSVAIITSPLQSQNVLMMLKGIIYGLGSPLLVKDLTCELSQDSNQTR